jgi:diaminopimelate decarboxylase
VNGIVADEVLMAKTIYTERDVQDLARRGIKEIAMTDEVYLTDVARERAEKLGIALRVSTAPSATFAPTTIVAPQGDAEQLVNQVKADVIAKLGSGVDAALIDRIVRRVIGQLK